MSEARDETQFDESVFNGGEATDGALEPKAPAAGQDAPRDADPRTKISDTAAKIGWSGKDDWKGDPADWLDAPEFILKAAGEVLPSMRKSLEKANEEISGLKKAVRTAIGHVSKARQDGYEQRSRELQAELDTAAAAGNVDDVRAITKDIVELAAKAGGATEVEQRPQVPPEFTAFQDDNDWYGKDRALTAAFDALCIDVHDEGYVTPKAGLKEALSRLREAFPEKFAKPGNPNRQSAPAVEGIGARHAGRGSKSFSDMPKEHQEMCLELMRSSKAITKDNYAKEYFAGEAK